MSKHRLKGFYIGGTLHWLIIMDGFKYLGGAPTTIKACLAMIEEEEREELKLIRRSLEDD